MTRLSDHLHCQDKKTAKSQKTSNLFFRALMFRTRNLLRFKLQKGEITIPQLYNKMWCPVMISRYNRMEIPYDLLNSLVNAVKNGELVIANSTWGKSEVKNGMPGIDDLFPDSYGYDEIGGPTYRIRVSKSDINVYVNFVDMDYPALSSENMDNAWQTRNFTFKNPEGNLSAANLMLFKDWILDNAAHRNVNRMINILMDDFANMFFEEEFNNEL